MTPMITTVTEWGAADPSPVPTAAELQAAGVRVLVGIPMERTVPGAIFPSLWHIATRGWSLVSMPYGRTDVTRNHMARALLQETNYTHLCMLDLDELHEPDIVERLARWVMDDPGKLIVSGLSFRRGEPFDPLAMCYFHDGSIRPIADWPDDTLINVDVIGHGSVLISRRVFETLPSPWWAYTYDDKHQYPSEDMYFCRRVYEAGIPIWVDTSAKTEHLTDGWIGEDTWLKYKAEHPSVLVDAETALSHDEAAG